MEKHKTTMQSKHFMIKAAAISLVLSLLIFACKQEYIYIGEVDPGTPKDTTSTGGSGGTGGGTVTTGKPCSPDSIYFELSVLPILRSNCALSGCHDAVSREEGIILDSYANTIKTGGIRVNSPASSKIYSSLNSTRERMPPPPMAALSDADKASILKWIQQGAKNLTCDGVCDSTQTSFKNNILPIVTLQCKGCHSGTAASGGGILLSTYAEIKKYVDNGKFLGSLVQSPGYSAMPKSGKLPDCDIRKIRNWIRQGALNN
jgi:hypothetical protein